MFAESLFLALSGWEQWRQSAFLGILTGEQVLLIAVLLLVTFLFAREKISLEIVALLAAGTVFLLGLIDTQDFLSSFSNSAVITIACMFVLSSALEHTGVIDILAGRFNQLAKNSERRALIILTTIPLVLSALVNNTPIVVVLLPLVLGFCRSSGVKPSRLLLPLSFATILGGTCSMVGTSTNLLIDGIVRQKLAEGSLEGFEPFSLFSILPMGVIYAAVGLAYLWFFAPKLLPARDTLASLFTPEMSREFLLQAQITPESKLIGERVSVALGKELKGVRLLEVRRRGIILRSSLEKIELQAGDRLLLRAGAKGIAQVRADSALSLGMDADKSKQAENTPETSTQANSEKSSKNTAEQENSPASQEAAAEEKQDEKSEDLGLQAMEEREALVVEGVIGPHSPLLGQTMAEAKFRQRYGVLVLAVHREGVNITKDFERLRLSFGDTLLVEGPHPAIENLTNSRAFLSLSEFTQKAYRKSRAWVVLATLVGFVGLGAAGVPTMWLAFFGALAVVLGGCLKAREVYESIDWKILLLIIGMLALGRALENTGTAEVIARGMYGLVEALGPYALVAGIYLITSVLTEMVSNSAVAVILTPVSINLASLAEISPLPLIVAIMFSASASFATPIGYQTNTYVFGAGGYKYTDFLKIGLPLNLILAAVATFCIPLFWPF